MQSYKVSISKCCLWIKLFAAQDQIAIAKIEKVSEKDHCYFKSSIDYIIHNNVIVVLMLTAEITEQKYEGVIGKSVYVKNFIEEDLVNFRAKAVAE